jgi:hypothetical protein
MTGGAFGTYSGFVIAYRGELVWDVIDLSGEGEFFGMPSDASGNFLYTWTELGYSPLDWLRVGVVAQNTRLYDRSHEYDPGFFAGAAFWHVDAGFYVFSPFVAERSYTLIFGIDF